MENFKKFLNKLNEETYQVVKEEESKDLAKEDALSLIADFVKDVKVKFKKDEDRLEILKSASKTLEFYIDEIEEGDDDDEDEFEFDDAESDFDDDLDFDDTADIDDDIEDDFDEED